MMISFKINGTFLDRGNRFIYLDACIKHDMNPDKEIKCKIEMARQNFMGFKQLWPKIKVDSALKIGEMVRMVYPPLRRKSMDTKSRHNEQPRSIWTLVLYKNA